MPSKYRSKKVSNENGMFDSMKEARRFEQLKRMEEAGEIQKLRRQIPFELIPSQELHVPIKKGKRTQRTELACKYYADFVYEKDGKTVVEDAKGFKTKEYRIKKKLMLWRYDIQIMEV